MAGRDIDISMNRPKNMIEFKDQEFDIVDTVCEEDDDVCPFSLEEKVIYTDLLQIPLPLI